MTDQPATRTPYADIPQTMRDLLDEVYTPEGVEMWWNARNRMLGDRSAHAMWKTNDGRAQVIEQVEYLTGGAW